MRRVILRQNNPCIRILRTFFIFLGRIASTWINRWLYIYPSSRRIFPSFYSCRHVSHLFYPPVHLPRTLRNKVPQFRQSSISDTDAGQNPPQHLCKSGREPASLPNRQAGTAIVGDNLDGLQLPQTRPRTNDHWGATPPFIDSPRRPWRITHRQRSTGFTP